MDKMTDSRAVEVLSEMREGDVLIDEADYVAALDHAIARLREPAGAPALIVDHAGNTHSWPLMNLPSGTRLFTTPQPPAEAQAQGGGEVEYEYEVWQNDSLEAGGSTSDYATAKSEADHYALMYGQDGPVEVRMYEKRRITAPPSAPDRDAYEGAREDLLDWKRRAQRAESTLRGLGYKGIDASEAPSAPVGVEVASLPALWRQREDNGEEHTEYDKGFETASDECARMLEAALAAQPAAVDGAYPKPRNRAEAAALAKLALAYLGVIDAHIDAAIARCETIAAQQPAAADVAGGDRV